MTGVDEGDWGNPTAKHFVRRNITDVSWEGRTVSVHRGVTHIMAAFMRAVGESYQVVPETALGWVAAGTESQRLGLRLDLPGVKLDPLIRPAADLGLTVGDSWVQFDGFAYEAERITRDILQNQTTDEASIESGFIDLHRPGTRELGVGDVGPDVYFLQEFLQCPDVDAVYGMTLIGPVEHFRVMRDLPAGGGVDQAFWLSMFPERPVQVEPGDAGMWVRMVQCLLAALDYSPEPISNIYGTRTTRAVREMQKLHALRPSGIIRAAEWGVLVHRPVDDFPLG